MRFPSRAVMAFVLLFCGALLCRASDEAPAFGSPENDHPSDSVSKDDAKDQFRTARRDIQARLRNKLPFERAAALRELQKYPTVDAAKLLVTLGLKDGTPEVRSAAYNTLLDFKDDADVTRYLLVTAGKESRRGAGREAALPLVAVLLASKLPNVERDVTAYLDKQTATQDGLLLVEGLADELGDHGQAEDVAAIEKLTRLAAFPREFGLRRAVVQALSKISEPAAVGILVALLENAKGELQADIVQRLTDVSSQTFGLDSGAWRVWWKENEKTFQMPASVARSEVRDFAQAGGGSRYYGLTLYAQKLVFIIDISHSMQGARLMAAKRELLQAIDGLPESTQFSVVAFNAQVHPWQRQLVPANSQMKRAASRFVEMLEALQHTASYDALEAGMRFDTEALYFLTDGAPHGGKVDNPVDIVNLITRENYSRRLSIYTIGIGVGPAGGVFDEFLSALAKQNWGVYRRVDE